MNEILKINNVFWTLQGEGLHAGRRALFVRMPYCNLKCSWCDTEFNSFEEWSPSDFVTFATAEPGRFAVITGGEPTFNKQTPRVVDILKGLGYTIAIETNGMFPIPDDIDFVTVSPKSEKDYQIHDDAFKAANEFKYVVEEGFKWEILKRHNTKDGRRYSLSPEFNRMEAATKEILSYIAQNPSWRLNLQTHKWIKIP